MANTLAYFSSNLLRRHRCTGCQIWSCGVRDNEFYSIFQFIEPASLRVNQNIGSCHAKRGKQNGLGGNEHSPSDTQGLH